jgi:hypothetical protein
MGIFKNISARREWVKKQAKKPLLKPKLIEKWRGDDRYQWAHCSACYATLHASAKFCIECGAWFTEKK